MPNLNRQGPNGEGPMTGRKMGRCNPDNKGKTEDEIMQGKVEENNDQSIVSAGRGQGQGQGRGQGQGQGQGRGKGSGKGLGLGLGRGSGKGLGKGLGRGKGSRSGGNS